MGVLQGITCGETEGRQTFEGAQPSVYWDIMPMTTRRPPCARAREHVVNMSPPTLSKIRSNPCSSTHNATVPTNTHLESLCQRPSDRVCPWLQWMFIHGGAVIDFARDHTSTILLQDIREQHTTGSRVSGRLLQAANPDMSVNVFLFRPPHASNIAWPK